MNRQKEKFKESWWGVFWFFVKSIASGLIVMALITFAISIATVSLGLKESDINFIFTALIALVVMLKMMNRD